MNVLHRIKLQLTLLICILTISSIWSQTTLVPLGSSWAYYDQGNEPSNQGSLDWNDSVYDDNNWSTGNAHLGYGDGDETTTINSSTLTCYVRHSFQVTDPTDYGSLELQLTYDDGAVVYLNGTEVSRVNMPTGTINYGTFSSSTSGENAMITSTLANTLVTGTNVLSVEIHQRSTSSSDISFDCKLTGVPAGTVSVARGPYLQQPTSASIIVKWRTSTPTESVVHFGTTQGSLSSTASHLTLKTNHALEINGLSADTKYYYDISNSNNVLIGGGPDLFFRTSPVIGTPQTVRAWILGDCGTANNDQRDVRDAYNAYVGSGQTDMILFLGDNAYNNGTDSEYQFAIFENMYEDNLKNTVSWSCLGNHDGQSANSGAQSGPYYDIFTFPKNGESGGMSSGTEAYYSFDHGNVHFISMDSYDSDRSVGGAMYSWCESDLQNTTADWIVAFWHHPPYSKGSHNSDTESNLIQMRSNFLPLLESYGVDLVLSGHSHSYERSFLLKDHHGTSSTFNSASHTVGITGDGNGRIDGDGAYEKTTSGSAAGDGAVYITAGSSGKTTAANLNHNAMFYSVAELGSCVLEVTGDTMNVKFVRETEAVEDYFTIIKPTSNCTPGTACNDGDNCTTGDLYNSNCDCVGTFQDADGDGVCDANDQCPGQNDNVIGTACDDGDACTDNDVYNNNCQCAGTLQDADGDGVCDADDQCPGLNDNLIGTACDDGDACTVNDVYDNNCQCAGTYQDTDSDGVCDADDQCPGQNDNVIGTACDDGDACTNNDVYNNNCQCAGTLQDADGDGVCDADDQCPGLNDNLIGTACDDGDACTVNDVYDNNCQCAGTYQDSDSDGVCDADDQCPGLDDNLIGTACNDGDVCTVNDVYNNSCQCAGTYKDVDGDGICAADDPDDNDPCNPNANAPACAPCTTLNSESFESTFGIWSSGGNDCDRSTSNANTGVYSVRLRDNSGNSSSMISNTLNLNGVSDVIFEFSFYTRSMENNEDFFLEISTNGGSSYSIYQEWNSGTEFVNKKRYNESLTISYAFTNNTRFRIRCDASANNDQVYIDDVVIKTCNITCNEGDPCDDNDPCTIGDVYDSNCDCAGTFQDTDADGVCDADDQCPGQNDNVIGTSCDDGDNCTTGDLYDNNCQCAGSFTDADNDGYCIGVDPNDGDACIPDANAPGCGSCPEIIADGFEINFGNWVDGGNDCSRHASNANTGSYSIKLRDNSGQASSMYSQELNLANYSMVTFAFSYYATSMENNEALLLELSTDGGTTYSIIQTWISGTDFNNKTRYDEAIDISVAFSNNTRFRLRCDASANNDAVYIDDVVITGCQNANRNTADENLTQTIQIESNVSGFDHQKETSKIEKEITFFPNPASHVLHVDLSGISAATGVVKLYNMQGVEVARKQVGFNHQDIVSLPIRHLANGLYMIHIQIDDQLRQTHKLIIAR